MAQYCWKCDNLTTGTGCSQTRCPWRGFSAFRRPLRREEWKWWLIGQPWFDAALIVGFLALVVIGCLIVPPANLVRYLKGKPPLSKVRLGPPWSGRVSK